MDTYTPDDQLDKLKAWWNTYGNALVAGIVIGAGLLIGINYWRHYQTEQSLAASKIFDQLLIAVQEQRLAEATPTAENLIVKYSGTPYAGRAAVILARLKLDAQDKEAARKQLAWAMDEAKEPSTRHVARLSLARLLLDLEEREQALALSQEDDTGGFEAEYLELRGDVLRALNKPDEARGAYAQALAKTDATSPYAQVIRMKLDDLGGVPTP